MQVRKSARKVARNLSYSNVIATMALFFALGGISWAAATAPKNTVAAKSIKKNAVTSVKIKNNAVTGRKIKSNSILASDIKNAALAGADIKDESLTGADINEGTLGKVPNAAVADGSSNQLVANVRVNSSASDADYTTARLAATEVSLAKHGTLEIYAKCFESGGSTYDEMYIRTSQDGAAFNGYSIDDSAYGDPALNTNTAETDRHLASDSASDSVSYEYATNGVVTDPNGATMMFNGWTWVRNGNATNAPAFFTGTNSCTFHLDGTKQ